MATYREIKGLVADKFKFLPTSVWNFKTNKLVKSLISDKNTAIRKDKHKFTESFKTYGYGETSISEFPEELARRIVTFWSEKGDFILDTCMGRATRGMTTLMNNRNYIGVDIDPKTCAHNVKIFNRYMKSRESIEMSIPTSFRVINADGCFLPMLKDESVDFAFTCPPYWNIEKYSGAKGDLSYCDSYSWFLRRIELMIKENYRILKPDSYCVWVVGDFRVNKEFLSFSNDIINLFKKNHFTHYDTIINVLKSPYVTRALRHNASRYYTSKTHDYTLVFYKGKIDKTARTKIPDGSHITIKKEQKKITDWKKIINPDEEY